MSYPVNSKPYPTFGFTYQGDNKTVDIEVGHDGDLLITDVLEAVKDVLIAGGFDYVNEVRAVSYGESEHTIHSSNREASAWTEPADVLPDDDDDLPRLMAAESLKEAGFNADLETSVNTKSSLYYETPTQHGFHD